MDAIFTIISILLFQIILHWNTGYTSTPSTIHTIEYVIPKRLQCEEIQSKFISTDTKNCTNINVNKTRFYEIFSRERTFYLYLEELTDTFLAPNFHVEHRFGELYSESNSDSIDRQCFYHGKLLGEQPSKVTLSTCGGLQGVMRTSTGDYFITPVNNTNTSGAVEHLLYVPDKILLKNTKTTTTCKSTDSSENKAKKIFHDYKFEYSQSGLLQTVPLLKRRKRALSVRRYIETMVVADESMFEYYGRKEIELRRYLLSIMAIVTSILKDSSIGNYIDVSVVKLVILKKNPHDLDITTHASQSLKRFCKWQKKQNKLNDDNPEHYDAAILVTRNDLCSSTDKCDTLGLAELGSVCDPLRSCAIVEDNGLSVAFTIAHELGHLINAPHDGENNECTETNGKVNIMTPTFSVNLNSWSWSTCSRSFITDFLESSSASCLLDKPSPKFEHPLPLKLPGEMFSRNEQCQLVYGKSSYACPFVTVCDRIWCVRSHNGRKSCHTNNMPWADGTKCGSNSWCIHGDCRLKEHIKAIDGGWGDWGPYSKCSRLCGGGLKFATRECDKPKPEFGGDYCVGTRHKYKSCNIKKCKENVLSFRAEQCQAFNGRNLGIPGVPSGTIWLPKLNGLVMEDRCKLFCEIKEYSIFYELAPKVIDGTKCIKGSNDICVDGQCRPAGCDNVLNSDAKLDNCGVCNGDNSTCRTYVGYKNTTHLGYNFVVHVPRGASQLTVIQMSSKSGKHDTNFLALLDARRQYVFNGQWRVSLGKRRYTTYGTAVYYSGPNEVEEKIIVPGVMKTALEIRVLSIAPSNKVNIQYSYKFPVRGTQKYKWALNDEWSSCFPICQGYQVKEYECQREIDSQVVSETKCTDKRPPGHHRICNLDCTLRWDVFKDECVPVASCGNGIQQQKVVCKLSYHKDSSKEDEILTHKDCHKAKIGKMPAREIPCFSPCTRVRWFYSPWSKCNKTCDGGMQSRDATCVDQENNSTQPMANCNSTPKAPLNRPCNTNPCPKWHTGAWAGVCSVTCGDGVVERLVSCVVAGRTVSDDQCSKIPKPDQTRPCIISACASWIARAWSKCSEPCGVGHQVREIYCETSTRLTVPEIQCNAADKPTERRKCFEKACELKAKLVFNYPTQTHPLVRWLTGIWGKCSSSCGGGVRERIVACVSNNVIIPENNCIASKKPTNNELCNVFSCPFWRHGAWSKCTKLCGKGTQTRLVLCGFNGTIVSDEWCESTGKSLERQYCNVHGCHSYGQVPFLDTPQETTNWKTGNWSKCSTSCGAGEKTRQVSCPNKECQEDLKPREVISCNSGACPGWNYGQWTPVRSCPANKNLVKCYTDRGCGTGWQARLVVCQMEDGNMLHNNACGEKYKPVGNRTCETEPCKKDAQWTTTPWQPCNVPCGDGIQFRYISCEDLEGNRLPESRCEKFGPRPDQQKSCRRDLCPSWYTSDWEHCDSTCSHHRVVECRRGGEIIDENQCDLDQRPIAEKECSNENCVKEPSFEWKLGEWSACGATCGYSLRSRDTDCINEDERVVKSSYCIAAKPSSIEQCFEGPCPPSWYAEPWTECSTTCGPGEKTRRVHCRGVSGKRLADTACQVEEKLEEKKQCSLGQCGNRYRWVTGQWSECSRSCGIGETRREVYCYNSRNVTQSRVKCGIDNMPANMKVCNTHSCPFLSCRDLQIKLGVKFDGEQKLQVGNQTLLIYCEGMNRGNPKEFITLKTDPKENFAEIYGKRLIDTDQCPNNGRRQIPCNDCVDYAASGVSFFKKVRLDIKSLTIVPEDKTFADRFGRNPPGFASAGDCYSGAKCPQGRFMVNLQGTGLRVADNVTWTSRGYQTSQKIRRHKNSQVIYGKCGGYCGMCSPNGLKLEIMTSSR